MDLTSNYPRCHHTAQLFCSSTWHMVIAREQEHTHCVWVSEWGWMTVFVELVSLFLSAHCVHVCLFGAAVLCVVKVSDSRGSHPSYGSSAEFAEWLVARNTAHPMSRSNENWCCMSTVRVFIAALLTMLPVPAATKRRYMSTAGVLNWVLSWKRLCSTGPSLQLEVLFTGISPVSNTGVVSTAACFVVVTI